MSSPPARWWRRRRRRGRTAARRPRAGVGGRVSTQPSRSSRRRTAPDDPLGVVGVERERQAVQRGAAGGPRAPAAAFAWRSSTTAVVVARRRSSPRRRVALGPQLAGCWWRRARWRATCSAGARPGARAHAPAPRPRGPPDGQAGRRASSPARSSPQWRANLLRGVVGVEQLTAARRRAACGPCGGRPSDDGDAQQRHRAAQRLVAEAQEVGQRAAAAGDDHDLDLGTAARPCTARAMAGRRGGPARARRPRRAGRPTRGGSPASTSSRALRLAVTTPTVRGSAGRASARWGAKSPRRPAGAAAARSGPQIALAGHGRSATWKEKCGEAVRERVEVTAAGDDTARRRTACPRAGPAPRSRCATWRTERPSPSRSSKKTRAREERQRRPRPRSARARTRAGARAGGRILAHGERSGSSLPG